MAQDPKGQENVMPDQKTPPMEGSSADKVEAKKADAKSDEKLYEAIVPLYIGTALAYPEGHKAVPAKSVKRFGWEDYVK